MAVMFTPERLPALESTAAIARLEAMLAEAQQEREQLRLRCHELIAFAPDGHVLTDRCGVIGTANFAAATLLGTRPEFLVDKPLGFFVAAEHRHSFYTHLRSVGGGRGALQNWRVRLHGTKGRDKHVAVSAVLSGADSQALNWLLRDVTARVHMETALDLDPPQSDGEAARQDLQAEQMAALGRLTANLAHEGRNALQRAGAALERLGWRLADQPEALRLVALAQTAQDDLRKLFEDVRACAGPLAVERSPCQLPEVWRAAWDHVCAVHPARPACLTERLGDVALSCQADGRRLGQVFRNVFENAFAACPGDVFVEVVCWETAVDGVTTLWLVVRDNGPGFNHEQRQRIFEPFFTTRRDGTGLGMAIARRIVEAHGGTIAARNAPQGGGEILISLPRSDS